MKPTKYDRPALKLEFFESDHDELKAFFNEKGVNYTSWNIARATRWRPKEKQERKEKIVEKALAKKQNELAKKLEIDVDDLLKAKKTVLELLKVKLNQYVQGINEGKPINTRDLETIWRMTKTELWEPTVVAKNENNTQRSWDWPLVQIIRADINQKK